MAREVVFSALPLMKNPHCNQSRNNNHAQAHVVFTHTTRRDRSGLDDIAQLIPAHSPPPSVCRAL